MESSSIGLKNCFSVTWKIENFRYYWQHRSSVPLTSPVFSLRTLRNEELKFKLHLKKNLNWDYISYCLQRQNDAENNREEVVLDYELSVFCSDGEFLQEKEVKGQYFQRNGACNFFPLLSLKKALGNPLETITVYCRLYENKNTAVEPGHCFVRTRISVRRTSFVGILKNFSILKSECREEIRIKTNPGENPVVSMNWSFDELGRIFIDLFPLPEEQSNFSTCEISVLGSDGNEIKCTQDKIWYEEMKEGNVCRIKLPLTKTEVMSEESIYLKNDDLLLRFKLSFADEIEYSIYIEDSS
ncbi:speckle-type POZ protein [Trichonephila clavata]|uniref:Speckle-type POZ protein n=1 Tax=Trichonephila clavata TaxID=2740835 RepID=A0A8X6GNM6_TRICU|nr:speckle-type POZ protein [Trichonephila clavata]